MFNTSGAQVAPPQTATVPHLHSTALIPPFLVLR